MKMLKPAEKQALGGMVHHFAKCPSPHSLNAKSLHLGWSIDIVARSRIASACPPSATECHLHYDVERSIDFTGCAQFSATFSFFDAAVLCHNVCYTVSSVLSGLYGCTLRRSGRDRTRKPVNAVFVLVSQLQRPRVKVL